MRSVKALVLRRPTGNRAILVAIVLAICNVAIGAPVTATAASIPGTNPMSSPLADPSTSLAPLINLTGHLSISVDGLASNNPAGGPVKVQKNTGATVRQAMLFAASTGFTGYSPVNGDVTIDGAPVAWDSAHTIPNSIASINVLADVTNMVKAKLDAAPPGMTTFTVAEPNNTLSIDGEILAVIFDDPTVTVNKSITLLYGAQNTTGDTFNVALTQPINKTDPNQQLTFGLGISFGYQAPGVLSQYSLIDVNGTRLSSAAGGQDDCDQKYAATPDFASCGNGALLTVGGIGDSTSNPPDPNATPQDACVPRCDDELYDLMPFVNNGDTSFTIHTLNPSNDDNIFFGWLLANPPASVTSGNCSPASAPIINGVSPFNGGAIVSWQPVVPASGCTITGYVVTATPSYNNRVPLPSPAAGTVSFTCPGDTRCGSGTSAIFTNLLMDCHQRYAISVSAEGGSLVGPPGISTSFRPSGIVANGTEPPTVAILLDGIAEFKPGFTMNPYDPTLPSGQTTINLFGQNIVVNSEGVPSYCPESWYTSPTLKLGVETEANFAPSPNGPWEFFNKWNFADLSTSNTDPSLACTDTSGNASPSKCSNSTPRDLNTQTPTNAFMLDAVAAEGGVILPYSYNKAGATLTGPPSNPTFNFPAYTVCDSTPLPTPTPPSAPSCGSGALSFKRGSISDDIGALNTEVSSIKKVWPDTPIVLLGHSQGGLVAWDWWQKYGSMSGTNVVKVFTLDSPITGVCPGGNVFTPFGITPCAGPTGYPEYNARFATAKDPAELKQDAAAGYPVLFIGTQGDTVPVFAAAVVPVGAYGPSGPENLQHELLVTGNACSYPNNQTDCQAPPNHISECDIDTNGPYANTAWIQDDQHFITKFCPGNVAFFNRSLGLNY